MRKCKRGWLSLLLELLIFNFAFAQPTPLLTISLDDYVTLAIKQGLQSRQNELTLESAGYTKQIAFTQTDSPNLSLNASGTRNQTDTEGNPPSIDALGNLVSNNGQSKTDTGQAGLTLNQPFVTGTALKVTGQTTDTSQSGFGQSYNQSVPNLTANLTQPLYLFVKNPIVRSRREAQIAFDNSKDSYLSTVLSLRAQAKSFYYNVMLGEESIKVAQRKVDSSRKLLDITQALAQAGKTAVVETTRAKVQLQTDERALENTIVSRDKAVLSAKNFIFVPLDQAVRFSSELQYKSLELQLHRLIDYAMLHQPQLQTLRRSRELATLSYQAALEPTRPMLSLDSQYSYSQTSNPQPLLGDLPPLVNRGWQLGGTLTWAFFDSGVTRDQTSVAHLGVLAADINLVDGERTTALNVYNAYLDVKNAEKQIADFQVSRDQARQNVEILRIRFQNGLERLIDVFDAETQMRDLDNEYLNLLISYNQLKDNLSTLIGADVETLR